MTDHDPNSTYIMAAYIIVAAWLLIIAVFA